MYLKNGSDLQMVCGFFMGCKFAFMLNPMT